MFLTPEIHESTECIFPFIEMKRTSTSQLEVMRFLVPLNIFIQDLQAEHTRKLCVIPAIQDGPPKNALLI